MLFQRGVFLFNFCQEGVTNLSENKFSDLFKPSLAYNPKTKPRAR